MHKTLDDDAGKSADNPQRHILGLYMLAQGRRPILLVWLSLLPPKLD